MIPLLQLDASLDRTITQANGLVSAWATADGVTSYAQATLAFKPRVYLTSNNRQAINFDGVNDYLESASKPLSAPIGASFIVLTQDLSPAAIVGHFAQSYIAVDDAHYVFLAQYATNSGGVYDANGTRKPRYRVNNGGGNSQWDVRSATPIVQGESYVIAYNLLDDGTVQFWVNGTLTGVLYNLGGKDGIGRGLTNWEAVPLADTTTVGCWKGNTGPQDFSNSGIHEILIYGPTTGQQIIDETARLAAKWNVTL